MNVTFIFFTQEKKFNAALDKLDVRQNTSLQVSILFVHLIAYIYANRVVELISNMKYKYLSAIGHDRYTNILT